MSTSLLPIQLTFGKRIAWINPATSSNLFLCPIRLYFTNETTDALSEEDYIQKQIARMKPFFFKLDLNGRNALVRVKCTFFPTMMDGAVINCLTETRSALSCYVCGATPSDMSDTFGE